MGYDIPETVADKPEVRTDLIFYWEAYLDLSQDRTIGFSLGPIPWRAINDWAIRYSITDPEEFQILKELIWKIDTAYLKYQEDNRKKS